MVNSWRLLICALLVLAISRIAAAQPEGDRIPAERRGKGRTDRVRVQEDIPYAGTDNERQRLDLILPPQQSAERLPVVAFIHGGGWRGGDRRAGHGRLMPLAESGEFACVSIGYRLSGEAKWPAQLHDCKAAIRWMRAHADQYNLDPERIGIMGPSAGGHLVALLGTSGDAQTLEGELGEHGGISTRVQCVVDIFGPADLSTVGRRSNNADSAVSQLLGGSVRENMELARQASPITYITSDDPPFLVIHGTEDRVVPIEQSERFVKALQEADVPVVFIKVIGGGHGVQNPEVNTRVRTFFDKHLRSKDVEVSGDSLPAMPR